MFMVSLMLCGGILALARAAKIMNSKVEDAVEVVGALIALLVHWLLAAYAFYTAWSFYLNVG